MPNPEALSTFKLALSLRSAAPRIEAHYQYYDTAVEPGLGDPKEGCDDWVLLKGSKGSSRHCSASLAHADATVPADAYVFLDPCRGL